MMPARDPSNLPLRDIHLPDSVSWWPPAPIWWLVPLLLLTAYLLYRWLKKRRHKTLSIAEQTRLETNRIRDNYAKHQDKALLARDLSELIRRVSISIFPRQEAASVTGEDWLGFLDQQAGTNDFTQGTGKILIEAPYQARPEYDSEELISLVERCTISIVNKQQEKKP